MTYVRHVRHLKQPVSKADEAYNRIKHDILTCAIEPGVRITESEFVNRYGMGRASIRSALKRLRQEAWITSIPRYGHLVAPLGLADTQDVFQAQAILEPAVCAEVAQRDVDVAELRRLNAACRKSPDDPVRFLKANTNFHAAVAAASGNALLAGFIRVLYERLERLLYASGCLDVVLSKVWHHHEHIIVKLEYGEAKEASAAMAQQISKNHAIMLDVLRKHGSRVVS